MKMLGAFLCAAYLTSGTAWAQSECVSYHGYGANSASMIGVHTGSSWAANSKDAPPISSAVAIWNDGCGGMAGSEFPTLGDNCNGDINITVEYRTGNMPDGQNPDSCARFDHNLNGTVVVGGTIEIWERTYSGADCSWVLPHVTLDNIIAHELGHVFGLANTDCPNQLMGPDAAVASVSSDECNAVDDAWEQPNEPPDGGEGPGDPQDLDPGGCSFAEFPCSPLIFDLNGDGVHTTSAQDSPVLFDLDGDGVPHPIGWTDPASEEGILYFDHNRSGWIDGGTELFGDATLLPDGERARNGFEALAAHDNDGDGVITPRDVVWGKLRLWVDRNHDAVMTHDENYALGELHVLEIRVSYSETMLMDRAGNQHRQQSTFRQRIKGASWEKIITRAVHDVYFAAKP